MPRAVSSELPTIAALAAPPRCADAAVVRQRVELEVPRAVEADRHARRPVERLVLDRPGDRVVGRIRDANISTGPSPRPRVLAAATRAPRSSISSTSTCAPTCAWTS
jgi:hypothetical protein